MSLKKNIGAITITPSTVDQTIPKGIHNGGGKVIGDPDLIAANIKQGVNIFGVTGNLIPGKRYASGTAYSDSSGMLTVTGLAFTPSIVKVKFTSGGMAYLCFLVPTSGGWYGSMGRYLLGASSKIDSNGNGSPDRYFINDGNNDILSNGFKIYVSLISISCSWEAWE